MRSIRTSYAVICLNWIRIVATLLTSWVAGAPADRVRRTLSLKAPSFFFGIRCTGPSPISIYRGDNMRSIRTSYAVICLNWIRIVTTLLTRRVAGAPADRGRRTFGLKAPGRACAGPSPISIYRSDNVRWISASYAVVCRNWIRIVATLLTSWVAGATADRGRRTLSLKAPSVSVYIF